MVTTRLSTQWFYFYLFHNISLCLRYRTCRRSLSELLNSIKSLEQGNSYCLQFKYCNFPVTHKDGAQFTFNIHLIISLWTSRCGAFCKVSSIANILGELRGVSPGPVSNKGKRKQQHYYYTHLLYLFDSIVLA